MTCNIKWIRKRKYKTVDRKKLDTREITQVVNFHFQDKNLSVEWVLTSSICKTSKQSNSPSSQPNSPIMTLPAFLFSEAPLKKRRQLSKCTAWLILQIGQIRQDNPTLLMGQISHLLAPGVRVREPWGHTSFLTSSFSC